MRGTGCQRYFVHIVKDNWSPRFEESQVSGLEIQPSNTPGRPMLDISQIMDIMKLTMPNRRPAAEDAKAAALRAAGALHPHPEHVTDELFARSPFFDRRDRVQVKYEMLRAHDIDGRRISDVARTFGTSRQALYTAAEAFRTQGIPGLLPRLRGPKRAHKCTDEILDFAERWRTEKPPDAPSVTEEIHRRFGISIHPRSLQRALARRAKKGTRNGAGRS